MSTNAKFATIFTGLLVAVIVVVIGIAVFQQQQPTTASPGGEASVAPVVLRENSHRLDVAEDSKVTLVEFLDFECEACGAYYPYVEELRRNYEGRVTFAFRYFPIPSHGNSTNAALAVESAANQDALEPMFAMMFDTQAQWGEKGAESQAPLFRTYAEELGLDMEQFDRDVADPATLERVQFDFNEARLLGVDGTPTFFLNGEKLDSPAPDELAALLDEALAQ